MIPELASFLCLFIYLYFFQISHVRVGFFQNKVPGCNIGYKLCFELQSYWSAAGVGFPASELGRHKKKVGLYSNDKRQASPFNL